MTIPERRQQENKKKSSLFCEGLLWLLFRFSCKLQLDLCKLCTVWFHERYDNERVENTGQCAECGEVCTLSARDSDYVLRNLLLYE